MAKEKRTPSQYAAIVDGVYRHDGKMGCRLYEICRDYFMEHYRGIFIVNEGDEMDIFHNSFETLLYKIENGKICVKDGVLVGKDGKLLTSSLETYFMGIAKLKYKEWVRKHPLGILSDADNNKKIKKMSDDESYRKILYEDDDTIMLSIIADCISKMSMRCSQILTLFYYEEKSYAEILKEIPSYNSKNALKTEKNRCLNTLRESANTIYNRFYL